MSSVSQVKFVGSDDFHTTLKARVDRYFRLTRQSPRDCWQMYLKTAVIISWTLGSYLLLVFFAQHWWQAVPLTISLGLAMAAVGFNIQHDGGHRAYSDRAWINRLMAVTLDMLGGSSYVWRHSHNILHHTFSNIVDHDADIDLGFLGRLAPHQRRFGFHRLQHVYLWFLYGLLPIQWQLFNDFSIVARGRISSHRMARPRGGDLAIFVGGKLLFFSLAFVIPMLLHPVLSVLLLYVLACWVNGLVLSVIFQLAHVVEEAQFPLPDADTGRIDANWAVHQVETTVDFARGNRLLSWYLGGLNYQIEHHLFPRICHIHYPRISRLVERTCAEFGVAYHAHRSLFSGIASHYRQLRRMGQGA